MEWNITSSNWVELNLRGNEILLRMWPSFLRRLRMTTTQSPSGKHPPSHRNPALKQKPNKPEPKRGKLQVPVNPQAELRRRVLTSNTVRVTDLPEFTQVNSKWRKIFIPSLYNAFFHSNAPFKDFVIGATKFIRIVQDLVNRVYPEVDYTIRRDDPIHLLVSSNYNLHMLY